MIENKLICRFGKSLEDLWDVEPHKLLKIRGAVMSQKKMNRKKNLRIKKT